MLALHSIAQRVLQLTAEERELAREIEAITRKLAPQLLDQPGVGPHSAAQLVLSSVTPGPHQVGSGLRPTRRRRTDPRLLRPNDPLPPRPQRRPQTQPRPPPSSSSPANAHTRQPGPTSNAGSKKAKPDAKQPAASSATSPATSTAYSNTDRHWRLDKHRSITGPADGGLRLSRLGGTTAGPGNSLGSLPETP